METVRYLQWDWPFSNPNFYLRWIWVWEWQLLELFCEFRQQPKTKIMYQCFLLFLLFHSRDWQSHFKNNSIASAYARWTLCTTPLANEWVSSAFLMVGCGLASGVLEWKVRAVDLCTFSDTELKWTDDRPGAQLYFPLMFILLFPTKTLNCPLIPFPDFPDIHTPFSVYTLQPLQGRTQEPSEGLCLSARHESPTAFASPSPPHWLHPPGVIITGNLPKQLT